MQEVLNLINARINEIDSVGGKRRKSRKSMKRRKSMKSKKSMKRRKSIRRSY